MKIRNKWILGCFVAGSAVAGAAAGVGAVLALRHAAKTLGKLRREGLKLHMNGLQVDTTEMPVLRTLQRHREHH
ncbi:MAG TPA: hypothetical protein VF532_00790 [Candidatus Angelobacter sp.]